MSDRKKYDGLHFKGDGTRQIPEYAETITDKFLNKIVRYDHRTFIFMGFDGENCTIQSTRTGDEMQVPINKVSYHESDQTPDQK